MHPPDTDLDALESLVLDAGDLFELESRVGRFNVFHALGVARTEIRHSNTLAWLLDPGESHALGDLFLKPVVMDLLRNADRAERPLSPAELDGADLNRTLVYRERKHIDLTIHSTDPPFVIAIENKIDAKEHSGQLGRYAETLDTDFPGIPPLRVFLTPDGDEPSEDDWTAYSYADLHDTLTRTRRLHAGSIGGDVGVFIDHYLSLIGSELMDDKEIDALCQRIYKNHKRAIDLIVERAASGGSEVHHAIHQRLLDDPEDWHIYNLTGKRIDFVPKSWLDWIPPIGRRRDDPRFWIRLFFRVGPQQCRLLFQIAPCSDPVLRSQLIERLTTDSKEFGLRSPGRLTNKWTVLWNQRVAKFEDLDEIDPDAVADAAMKRLHAFQRDVDGIDAACRELFTDSTSSKPA